MAYCRKCGNTIDESFSHCGYCGDDRSVDFNSDTKNVKVASALAYLGILFFLPLVICPDSKKGRFHANQGLVLFIMNMVVSFVSVILTFVFTFIIMSQVRLFDIDSNMTVLIIGIIGFIIVWMLLMGFGIFILVLQILGIINGAKGIEQKLPLIGKFKIIK